MDLKVAQLAEQLLESGFNNFSEREQAAACVATALRRPVGRGFPLN
jgi:hypothetical protein